MAAARSASTSSRLFTALILFLAANTAFNAFPRLAAILAQDGFMPRQFSFRGDRLAFSLGIVVLGVVAASLVIFFGGETHLLIPLYSVGVFVSFTISQSGMVRHWLHERTPGWVYRISINAFGAVLTGVVAVVVTVFKAPESLLVVVIIPILVGIMLFIERQYRQQAKELEVRPETVIGPPWRRERVVIPVPGINRAVVQAVNFGRSISEDVLVVHVTDDVEAAEALRSRFEQQMPGVSVVLVESPFRSLIRPFVTYLDVITTDPEMITIVVLPEYVARHWWDRLLYNQVTNGLKRALLGRPNTVVTTVPYRRESDVPADQPPTGGPKPRIARGLSERGPPRQPASGGIVPADVLCPSRPSTCRRRPQRRPHRCTRGANRMRACAPDQGQSGRRPHRRGRLVARPVG